MKILFYIIIAAVAFSGCANFSKERMMEERAINRAYGEFDLSAGHKSGILKVQSLPPSQQYAISTYQILIDDHEPVTVSKHSETDFILDEGEHTVIIRAIPDFGPFGESFGKPTIEKIVVSEGDILTVEYVGPFWEWSRGKFRKIKN